MHLFFHHLSSSWCNDESKHKHVNESLWVCEAAEWSHQEEQSGVSWEGTALSVIEVVSRDTGVKIVIIILSERSHSFMDCRKQQGALVSLYNNIYKVEAKRVQPSLLWFLLQCKSMRFYLVCQVNLTVANTTDLAGYLLALKELKCPETWWFTPMFCAVIE